MVLLDRVEAKKTQGGVQDRQALLYCHRAPIALWQNKEHARIPHSNGTHHAARQRGATARVNSRQPNLFEIEDSRTLLFLITEAIANHRSHQYPVPYFHLILSLH